MNWCLKLKANSMSEQIIEREIRRSQSFLIELKRGRTRLIRNYSHFSSNITQEKRNFLKRRRKSLRKSTIFGSQYFCYLILQLIFVCESGVQSLDIWLTKDINQSISSGLTVSFVLVLCSSVKYPNVLNLILALN